MCVCVRVCARVCVCVCACLKQQWSRWDFGCPHHLLWGKACSPASSQAHSACLVHRHPGSARFTWPVIGSKTILLYVGVGVYECVYVCVCECVYERVCVRVCRKVFILSRCFFLRGYSGRLCCGRHWQERCFLLSGMYMYVQVTWLKKFN